MALKQSICAKLRMEGQTLRISVSWHRISAPKGLQDLSLIAISVLLQGSRAAASEPACFSDSDSYMVATYGVAFHDDDNLVIAAERYGQQVYYVARDRTSGTNHPLTLLMPTAGKGLCKVLTTYPVAAITPITYDEKGRPTAFSARDQGTVVHEIIYIWHRPAGEFKPAKCRKTAGVGNDIQSKSISCDELFE